MNTAIMESVKKKYAVDGLRSGAKRLAEAIILQSLEDLWSSGSRKFFGGEGFKICADIAGLNTLEQFKILHLIGGKRNGRNARLHRN